MKGLTLTVQGPIGVRKRLVGPLPPGDAGTDATIAAMIAVIHATATHSVLVRAVARSMESIYPHVAPVYEWLRRHIKFHRDPPGLEFLRHPDRIIAAVLRAKSKRAIADCDDVAMLGCALLLAMGERPVLIVTGTDPGGPFEHVYFGVLRREGRRDVLISMDPQEGKRPGETVPGARRKIYNVIE